MGTSRLAPIAGATVLLPLSATAAVAEC